MSLGDFLQERIFAPLGMKDTAFQVPEDRLGRLATAYIADPAGGGLTVCDAARGGQWSRPPSFPSGGGGLVSTADDYLAFARMMLGQGRLGATRLLARPTVELMRTDQLTAEQKSASPFVPGFWETTGWGLGMSVVTGPARFFPAPGSFGWDGGFSTSWRSDPKEDLTGILLVQRMMTSPIPFALYSDFWTLAYQAIDD
ncbi:MAG: serine hydrolase, partial [Alphaproteobacteria bacterium]|nr:serine hydrolase [Alphaproteobacteria bacterium]